MTKNIIKTDKAPAAIGPYSQAIEVNGIIYTSGVIPIDPATNTLVEGDSNIKINNYSKIEEGKPGCLTFLANPKYEHY